MFEMPRQCPVCGEPTEIIGDFLYCINDGCSSRDRGFIKSWIQNIGILYWGDAMIDSMIDDGVSSVSQLYKMSPYEIQQYCSGQKMADKCFRSLHEAKVTLITFLASLNIKGVGTSVSSLIVDSGFDSIDKILSITYNDLVVIDGIGDKIADVFVSGIQAKKQEILELSKIIEFETVDSKLADYTICITGDTPIPRSAIHAKILELGGKVSKSVSSKTNLLVCSNLESNSSKMKKAKKLGCNIMHVSDFMRMIDE